MRRPWPAMAALLVLGLTSPAAHADSNSMLLRGVLLQHGLPVAGRVLVYGGPPGPNQDQRVLITADVSRSGQVSVPLPATAALTRWARANDGYVNFMLLATDGTFNRFFAFSRRLLHGTWAAERDRFVRIELSRGVRDPRARRLLSMGRGLTPEACIGNLLGTSNAYTTVGEVHTVSNVSETLVYGQSADSDIGVAVSPNGSSWSLSGSVHIGNSLVSTVKWTRSNEYGHRESSQFHYEKKSWTGVGCTQNYSITATKWNGGAIDGSDNHSYDHKCGSTYSSHAVAHAPGTSFGRSQNNYVTFSVAATVFSYGGFTAQSGLSTWVTTDWSFNQSSGNILICGNDDSPTYATRIFVG